MMQYPGQGQYQPPQRRREHTQIGNSGHTRSHPHREAAEAEKNKGTVHMIILALDYKGTSNPLTCTVDAGNMKALAQASGVQDITELKDTQCTKNAVISAIQQVGACCRPHDVFILNYSGHGTSVTDTNGDEVDGKDEAYVLCDENGQSIPPTDNSLMTDDEIAQTLVQSIHKDVSILVISDCCHSGTMCDFTDKRWLSRPAVSISGCRDTQTSGDTGNGGICTHSLLMGVQNMQDKDKKDYSVHDLFREVLKVDDSQFHSPQDITINCARGFDDNWMTWPLVPKSKYTAPYRGGSSGGGAQPTSQYVSAQPTTQYVSAQPTQYVSAQPATQYISAQPTTQYMQPTSYVSAQPATNYTYMSAQPATNYITPSSTSYISAQPASGVQYIQPTQYTYN
jgi:hypothetical protein